MADSKLLFELDLDLVLTSLDDKPLRAYKQSGCSNPQCQGYVL